MIKINLLPPEYRPRTGTPVARFVAIVAGVILVASSAGVFAYTHFIDLTRARELRIARTDELEAKSKLRDRSLALQKEIQVYEKRRKAIQTINGSRTLWSRKLDQFFDIVTGHGTDESYLVWMESCEVPVQLAARTRRGNRRGQPPPTSEFKFQGHVAMNDDNEGLALSSTFHKALTGDPEVTGRPTEFFFDFQSVSNPGLEIVKNHRKEDEDLIPPIVGDFKYELKLKPLDGKSKTKKKS